MLQTCCAISRKHSSQERKSSQQSSISVDEFSPTEDKNLGLLDYSNLNLEQFPLELISTEDRSLEELKHLILDENQLDEQALESLPELPSLETLSLNGNCIKNCGVLLQILCRKAPHLKCLSLIGNPGWPHPILGGGRNLELYKKYALSAVQLLPTLQFLDTARVYSGGQNQNIPNSTNAGLPSSDHRKLLVPAVCRVV
ncbi:unnamed protein product [Meloidogyne enterolobii]|uniref:Uncharacterized protein n=1 Tax=Meloidogyne enterolobii TaxID=390850 RepID=A0ACB0XVA3_MELEN